MPWQLASGTGYCEAGGELVFFDPVRDRYFALRGSDREAFERLRSGRPNNSAAMTRLVDTGFLTRTDGPARLSPAAIEVPPRDLSALDDASFSLFAAFRAARSLLWAGRAMRPDRIAATIESLRRAKARIGVPTVDGPASEVALRFVACRWVVPVTPRCLIDALALDRILLARGLAATMVFGVQLDPFRAHCWLQTPERVLTGTSAEARAFTPILVVE